MISSTRHFLRLWLSVKPNVQQKAGTRTDCPSKTRSAWCGREQIFTHADARERRMYTRYLGRGVMYAAGRPDGVYTDTWAGGLLPNNDYCQPRAKSQAKPYLHTHAHIDTVSYVHYTNNSHFLYYSLIQVACIPTTMETVPYLATWHPGTCLQNIKPMINALLLGRCRRRRAKLKHHRLEILCLFFDRSSYGLGPTGITGPINFDDPSIYKVKSLFINLFSTLK